ncbi:MAG: hypothetical protein FWE02_01765 [Defluviitaleaceae bacterium]|nr:hypothetical protein [Defluviitaleaceae bacterium]
MTADLLSSLTSNSGEIDMSSPLGAIASDIAMQLENGVITAEEANALMREALSASQTGHMTLNTMDVDIGTIEEKMAALDRLMDATHGIALASSMAEVGALEGDVGAEETSENTEEKAKEGKVTGEWIGDDIDLNDIDVDNPDIEALPQDWTRD